MGFGPGSGGIRRPGRGNLAGRDGAVRSRNARQKKKKKNGICGGDSRLSECPAAAAGGSGLNPRERLWSDSGYRRPVGARGFWLSSGGAKAAIQLFVGLAGGTPRRRAT